MEIGYYEHAATIAQKVVLTAPSASLKGYVEWMVCNDVGCTPMQYWDFEIDLTSASGTAVAAETMAAGGGSLWGMILEAILWGFAALLTPCVFPMVPMTVSFFLKGSENKARGRFRAGMYGLFIILLYTLPIAALIIITRWLGGDAVTADIFNWLATHWLPNIIFFIVFMIFAASFFRRIRHHDAQQTREQDRHQIRQGRSRRHLLHGAHPRAGLFLLHGPHRRQCPYQLHIGR